MTCNHKVLSSNLNVGFGCDVRAVKEFDLKSNGHCPRRFKSCSQRVMLPERLTGQTANLMGFARTSSNLVHNDLGD